MPAERRLCPKCKHSFWSSKKATEHKCPYCGWVLEDGTLDA